MDLLFIRHAESANNVLERDPGAAQRREPDPALTPRGLAQAHALAADFRAGLHPRPAVLYSSLMLRAVQTAAPLAAALGLATIARADAHEFYGPVEFIDGDPERRRWHPGTGRTDLLQANPSLVLPQEVTDSGWWSGPVEDHAQSVVRAQRLREDLLARHPQDVVALVSHGTFGHIFLSTLFGTAAAQVFLLLENAAVTLITGLTPTRYLPGEYTTAVLRYLGTPGPQPS